MTYQYQWATCVIRFLIIIYILRYTSKSYSEFALLYFQIKDDGDIRTHTHKTLALTRDESPDELQFMYTMNTMIIYLQMTKWEKRATLYISRKW